MNPVNHPLAHSLLIKTKRIVTIFTIQELERIGKTNSQDLMVYTNLDVNRKRESYAQKKN